MIKVNMKFCINNKRRQNEFSDTAVRSPIITTFTTIQIGNFFSSKSTQKHVDFPKIILMKKLKITG